MSGCWSNLGTRFFSVITLKRTKCLVNLLPLRSMADIADNAIKVAKTALRKDIKAKLSSMTLEEEARQSKLVVEKLLKNERFVKSKRVSVYLSMQHEIDTTEVLKYLFSQNKECFIPKYRVGGAVMDMVPLYSWDDYEKLPVTKWKIKQPAADDNRPDALETGGLDIIVSPGLGFTLDGLRLGHGRGYYDSYLKRCIEHPTGKPFCIGLALNEQIVTDIPVGCNDVPLDLVVTS